MIFLFCSIKTSIAVFDHRCIPYFFRFFMAFFHLKPGFIRFLAPVGWFRGPFAPGPLLPRPDCPARDRAASAVSGGATPRLARGGTKLCRWRPTGGIGEAQGGARGVTWTSAVGKSVRYWVRGWDDIILYTVMVCIYIYYVCMYVCNVCM